MYTELNHGRLEKIMQQIKCEKRREHEINHVPKKANKKRLKKSGNGKYYLRGRINGMVYPSYVSHSLSSFQTFIHKTFVPKKFSVT